MLFVDDLLNAYDAALQRIGTAAGQVYNLGGGPDKTLAIWTEFEPILENLLGRKIEVGRGSWRPGDQKIFVSDIRKAGRELGWTPKVGVQEGIVRLFDWVQANQSIF